VITVLRDTLVKAARCHRCRQCDVLIDPGEHHRHRVETSAAGIVDHRWCGACMKLHAGYPFGPMQTDER
jgi:hypothetical protein